MFRKEVSSSLHLRRHRHPSSLEAERLELTGEGVTRCSHAGLVQRSRVDVNDLGEKGSLLGQMVFHVGSHLLLGGSHRLSGRTICSERCTCLLYTSDAADE